MSGRVDLLRCPYCHDALQVAGGGWVACGACLARHHAPCWGEARRCASCSSRSALVRARSPAAPHAPRPTTVAHVVLLLLALVAAGHGAATRLEADRDLFWYAFDWGVEAGRSRHVVRTPGGLETIVDRDDWLVVWRLGDQEDAPIRAAVLGVDVVLREVDEDGVSVDATVRCKYRTREHPLRPYAALLVTRGAPATRLDVDVDRLRELIASMRRPDGRVDLEELRRHL